MSRASSNGTGCASGMYRWIPPDGDSSETRWPPAWVTSDLMAAASRSTAARSALEVSRSSTSMRVSPAAEYTGTAAGTWGSRSVRAR